MNLPQETKAFTIWSAGVLRQFMRLCPYRTLAVICASGMARLTNLLAFFLPLKAILLAGSDGVPRYFPFIDPGQKLEWVIILAGAALVSYVLTLFLETVANSLSEDVSSEIMQSANEITIFDNQESVIRRHYVTFCQVSANLLFAILGMAILAVLSPWLFLLLAVLLIGQYVLSGWSLSGDDFNPGRFKRYIQERLGNYLKILSSVNFLAGFVVLLIPFVVGAGGNILVAILSIVLLRQLLGSLTSIPVDMLRLAKDKYRVDALVLPDAQVNKPEDRATRALQTLFSKPLRQQRGVIALRDALDEDIDARVNWADSPLRFMSTLVMEERAAGGAESGPTEPRYFQQQIFPPNSRAYPENEAFLFRHVDPARLYAPRCIGRFREGPFECQIVDYGVGRAVTAKEWKKVRGRLIEAVLTCDLPPRLVRAYRASHRLLSQRLDGRLLARLRVAVDSDDEAAALQRFEQELPAIAERLENLPLCIDNRDLNRNTCGLDPDGQPLAMVWGRWSLEPLGATLFTHIQNIDVGEMLPALAAARADIHADTNLQDIELARLCRLVEFHDERFSWKAAIRVSNEIVALLDAEHAGKMPPPKVKVAT